MINPERYRQIDELFQAALEVEPAKRSAFVSSACGGDESLREEVEALLSSAEQEWELIDRPVPEIGALFLPERPPELSAGEQLGHYKVLSLLGTGGMGQVYLAEDSRLGRKIALKLLPREFTENELRLRRFQHEARAASSLNHPNILTIYDIAQIDGKQLIATEFIDGETLRQHRQRRELNTDEVLDIAVQVASALSAAHQAGIIHRDIKPENVMLRRDGLVKVLDFGLAKLSEQDSPGDDADSTPIVRGETGAGLLMGTLPYMSPEQIRGDSVDARSDIFSLGAVLYEMTTGHAPFKGETNADLIASILEDNPPPPETLSPVAASELQRIIGKALIKNKEERYQTSEDLLNDLKTLKDYSLVESRIERSGDANTRFARAKTYGIRVLLAAALIVVLGMAYILTKSTGGSGLTSRTMTIAAVAGGANALAAAISHDGKYVAYVMEDGDKRSIWVRNLVAKTNIQIAPSANIEYDRPTFSPDDNDIYYVRTSDDPATLWRIPRVGGDSEKVLSNVAASGAFSRDGRRLAFIRNLGEGRTVLAQSNADGSEEQVLAERLAPAYFSGAPAWSPDGKVIACCVGARGVGQSTRVVGIETEGGAEKEISSKQWGEISQVAWLPDGAGLILTAVENDKEALDQVWRISYPGGEPRKITNDLNNYGAVSLTADSRNLVTIRFEWRSNVWVAPNGDSAKATPVTLGKRDSYRFVSWTPDGKIVFPSNANGDRDVWIMEADGTGPKQLTFGSGNLQSSASPDGQYIVFASSRSDAGVYNVWRMNIDGSNPIQLTRGKGEIQPRCSPDGKWVIYTSSGPEGRIADRTIWKVPIDGGVPVQLTDKSSNWPDLSPDGKFVACWYQDDPGSWWRIALLPVEGGPPVRLIKLPRNSPGGAIRWMPDGKAIAFTLTRDRVANIWSQGLDDDAPKQLTNFTSEDILCFDWSRNGDLVCSRFSIARDIVLIRDF